MDAAGDVGLVRRRLLGDGLAMGLSALAFATVYGVAAREAGFSLVEVMAMSVLVLAGSAQFAAVGLVAQGVPWVGIVLLTALLNTRHLLYAASLATWFTGVRLRARAAAAHVLTNETFALAMPATRHLGRLDLRTYTLAAMVPVVPWIAFSAVGFMGGQLLPDPRALGLDVVFPAAMAGLAMALATERRGIAALIAGASIALATGLAVHPAVGIVVGGLVGPLVALAAAPGATGSPVSGGPGTAPADPGGSP